MIKILVTLIGRTLLSYIFDQMNVEPFVTHLNPCTHVPSRIQFITVYYFAKFNRHVAETQIPQRHRTLGGISGPSCKVVSKFQVRFVACIQY